MTFLISTAILLAVLIFVHELGHFMAAKSVGVGVERFSIGLGPKLFGVTIGETEYVISAIPLGGFVKMQGMDDEVMERIEGGDVAREPREPSPKDFDQKPVWARTWVISAGVIMNMLFAFVTYAFVAAGWGIPDYATTRVGTVQSSLLPAGAEELGTLDPGTRFVSVGGTAVEDWGDVQRALRDATPGPLTLELVEPARTLQVTIPEDEDARASLAGAIAPWLEAGVGTVVPGSPAEAGGIQAGDRIVEVDGVPVEGWYALVSEIQQRAGERVELTINREDRELIRAVVVDSETESIDGERTEVGRIGIYQPGGEMTFSEASFGDAVVHGYRETVAVTGLIVGFLGDLVTGGVSARSVGSIVTIGQASGQAAQQGMDYFLRFMALFSVNLAVLNLLPIPVLDGGHLLFLGIEAARGGKPLSVDQRLRWSNVGLIVIVALMVWALSNDFLRLFGL